MFSFLFSACVKSFKTIKHSPFPASFIFVPAFLLLSYAGCKDKIVDPPIKNPREFSWTIDTLAYPGSFQTVMSRVWGGNAQDVYLVGHASGWPSKMYHYDGKKWEPVKVASGDGGPIERITDPTGIFGFSSKSIYVVGSKFFSGKDSSLIIHYDGARWTEHFVSNGRWLLTVWGASPNDIWAGGLTGTLFHFNGAVWTKVPMPDSLTFRSITGSAPNDVYALAYKYNPQGELNSNYIFHWDGSAWSLQDSFTESITVEDKFGRFKLVQLPDGLFSLGYSMFKKEAAGWRKIFGNRTIGLLSLCGTSSNNFFATGFFGAVYHFNGSDWSRFTQFTDDIITYSDCWTDGKEVFIVGRDDYKTYVLHGK